MSGEPSTGITGIVIEELTELTIVEVSRACAVETSFIVELVAEGVLDPQGREAHDWRFTGAHLRRAGKAARLQKDLGVNMAGIALALQLLDEMERLEAELNRLGSR